jgi:hypothetical protein
MLFRNSLEIEDEHFDQTKNVLIKNGSKISEQLYGSRRILYSNGEVCGYAQLDYYLPISENLPSKKFYSFLASFKRSLYNQFKKNNNLLNLRIEYNGLTRDTNFENWRRLKNRSKFYVIDLNSAYWQFAYKLGYISKTVFEKYIDLEEYKEAKRYAVSFLARENEMIYHDGRSICNVQCEISCLYQVYENIRNEMYKCISELVSSVPDWLVYNIDSISVCEKDVKLVEENLQKINLKYKVEEAIKIDDIEYCFKGKVRKF